MGRSKLGPDNLLSIWSLPAVKVGQRPFLRRFQILTIQSTITKSFTSSQSWPTFFSPQSWRGPFSYIFSYFPSFHFPTYFSIGNHKSPNLCSVSTAHIPVQVTTYALHPGSKILCLFLLNVLCCVDINPNINQLCWAISCTLVCLFC